MTEYQGWLILSVLWFIQASISKFMHEENLMVVVMIIVGVAYTALGIIEMFRK